VNGGSKVITNATIVKHGEVTEPYSYMREYTGL